MIRLWAEDVCWLIVQADSGALPASYSLVPGALYPRLRMSGTVTPFPLYDFMARCLMKNRVNFTYRYEGFSVLSGRSLNINVAVMSLHSLGQNNLNSLGNLLFNVAGSVVPV